MQDFNGVEHEQWKVWVTLPFLLCTRSGMLGLVSSSKDSCSDSFFFRRSMTLEALLALWNQETGLRTPSPFAEHTWRDSS